MTTRIIYDPKSDDVRVVYRTWTDDTYAVHSAEAIVMIDHDEIVGVVFPNYLRLALEKTGHQLPKSDRQRMLLAEEVMRDAQWLE